MRISGVALGYVNFWKNNPYTNKIGFAPRELLFDRAWQRMCSSFQVYVWLFAGTSELLTRLVTFYEAHMRARPHDLRVQELTGTNGLSTHIA